MKTIQVRFQDETFFLPIDWDPDRVAMFFTAWLRYRENPRPEIGALEFNALEIVHSDGCGGCRFMGPDLDLPPADRSGDSLSERERRLLESRRARYEAALKVLACHRD